MTDMIDRAGLRVAATLADFIETSALPGTNLTSDAFWKGVADIYALCEKLMKAGVTINRPPRDGHMAFIRSPDGISIELLQEGALPPQEPWASMPNSGNW